MYLCITVAQVAANDQMKVAAFKAIHDGEEVTTIHVSAYQNKTEAREKAAAKLKFKYPETYHFIKLKYVGFIELQEPRQ